jgi:hypothetical protein
MTVLLVLQFFQHFVQTFESARPGRLIGPNPVVDGLEGLPVQAVDPLPALVADSDEADLPKHPEVLGDERLRQPEQGDQVVDGPLATREQIEDLPAPRFGDRIEGIRRGRCSGHRRHYMPISAYVKAREH